MSMIVGRAQFIDALRDALISLYDPYALKRNPLQAILARQSPGAAVDLKQVLISSINALMPDEQTPVETKAWKIYEILNYRFIDQMEQKETAKTLLISLRTLQRLSPEAIEILAEKIAKDYHLTLTENETAYVPAAGMPAAESAPAELDETWIKETTALQTRSADSFIDNRQMLKEISEILQPMSGAGQSPVQIELPEETWMIRGQVTFLRQAVLTAISMFNRHTPALEIVVTSQRAGSRGLITIRGKSRERVFPDTSPMMNSDILKALSHLMHSINGSVQIDQPSTNEIAIMLSLPVQSKYNILMVDDNADAIRLVEKYLDQSMFTLTGVQEPAQVVAEIELRQPDLILLDVMLPTIDGWMLLSHIRRNPLTARIPVIVSTILPQEGLSISLGANGFLRKPFTRQELIAALETHLLKNPT